MGMAPMEMNKRELGLLNNPKSILYYQNKVGLDLGMYLKR